MHLFLYSSQSLLSASVVIYAETSWLSVKILNSAQIFILSYFFQKKIKCLWTFSDKTCYVYVSWLKRTRKNSTTNKKRYERKLVLFVYTLSNILFSFWTAWNFGKISAWAGIFLFVFLYPSQNIIRTIYYIRFGGCLNTNQLLCRGSVHNISS